MITEIRAQFKASGFKIIIILITIAMAISFAPFFRGSSSSDGALMTINGKAITPQELQSRVYQVVERLQFFGKQLGIPMEMFLKGANPQALAMQSLVEDTLLDQTADKARIALSPLFVESRLRDPQFVMYELSDVIPYSIVDQNGSLNEFALRQYLQKTGRTMSEFEKAVENALRRGFVKDIITGSAYILPSDVKHHFIATRLGKTFNVLKLSLKDYLAKEAGKAIDQKALKAFFDAENKRAKRYVVPSQRAGKAYIFNPEEYGISISDKKIKQYYDTNKAKKYLATPAQVRIRSIVFDVDKDAPTEKVQAIEKHAQEVLDQAKEKPEEFVRLVKNYSDDKQAAKKDGLSGYVKRNELEPALDQAAFRLKKDGDVSELLVTSRGFEIIQRVDKKAPEYKTFDSVKDAIRAQLVRQQFAITFGQDMNKRVQKAKKDPAALLAFAKEKKAVDQIIPLGNKDESHFTQKLFQLKKGEWAYYMHDKKGIVVQLGEVKKSYVPQLKEVGEAVKKDFIEHRAKKALAADLKKAEKLAATTSLEEVKKAVGGIIESTGEVKKSDSERINELKGQGVPIASLMSSARVGAVVSNLEPETGFILKLTAIEPFSQDLFEKEKDEVRMAIQRERETAIMQGFVASLYRNATIKSMNPDLSIKG